VVALLLGTASGLELVGAETGEDCFEYESARAAMTTPAKRRRTDVILRGGYFRLAKR